MAALSDGEEDEEERAQQLRNKLKSLKRSREAEVAERSSAGLQSGMPDEKSVSRWSSFSEGPKSMPEMKRQASNRSRSGDGSAPPGVLGPPRVMRMGSFKASADQRNGAERISQLNAQTAGGKTTFSKAFAFGVNDNSSHARDNSSHVREETVEAKSRLGSMGGAASRARALSENQSPREAAPGRKPDSFLATVLSKAKHWGKAR